MKFKKGMYIDETSLTKEEADEFIYFLKQERERHQRELQKYKDIAVNDETNGFVRILAMTVVVRHMEDIEHTNRTINYLVDKYGE